MSRFRYAEMVLGNWYVNKRWSVHVAPFAAAAAAWRTTTMHCMNHKFFRNENGVIIDANCSMKREIWLWKIVRMGPECTCSSMMYPSKKKKKSPIIRDIHKHLLQWDLEIVFVNWPFSKLNRRLFSSNTSRLEAHTGFFRLPMKGIFILMYCDLLTKNWFPN